jgi:hypothetical protein
MERDRKCRNAEAIMCEVLPAARWLQYVTSSLANRSQPTPAPLHNNTHAPSTHSPQDTRAGLHPKKQTRVLQLHQLQQKIKQVKKKAAAEGHARDALHVSPASKPQSTTTHTHRVDDRMQPYRLTTASHCRATCTVHMHTARQHTACMHAGSTQALLLQSTHI